jgi:hypothetical protein
MFTTRAAALSIFRAKVGGICCPAALRGRVGACHRVRGTLVSQWSQCLNYARHWPSFFSSLACKTGAHWGVGMGGETLSAGVVRKRGGRTGTVPGDWTLRLISV